MIAVLNNKVCVYVTMKYSKQQQNIATKKKLLNVVAQLSYDLNY